MPETARVGVQIGKVISGVLQVLLDEAARTDITRTLTRYWFYRGALHTGGWRVSVSPTLVESSVATPGPCEG